MCCRYWMEESPELRPDTKPEDLLVEALTDMMYEKAVE